MLSVLCWLISMHPAYIENQYSTSIYPKIASFSRKLLVSIPFSVGDVCYALLILWVIKYLIQIIILIIKGKFGWVNLLNLFLGLLKKCLWLYVVFNVLWGFNYGRLGIAHQLHLNNTHYTDADLQEFTCNLVEEIIKTRKQLGDSNYHYPTNKQVFALSINAYDSLCLKYPFINYVHPSIKPSLLTTIVSYAGYSGYYNPFTGEAQVNTDLPLFYLPFVTCHEMAHQIGYASESEASFVGYLAAIHSKNVLLRYGSLFELFTVANNELMKKDFWAALLNIKSLSPMVRRDRRIFREYILGKQNSVEPIIKNVYDQYLKANKQKTGIDSYDEVVGWVIAYRRVNGKDSNE